MLLARSTLLVLVIATLTHASSNNGFHSSSSDGSSGPNGRRQLRRQSNVKTSQHRINGVGQQAPLFVLGPNLGQPVPIGVIPSLNMAQVNQHTHSHELLQDGAYLKRQDQPVPIGVIPSLNMAQVNQHTNSHELLQDGAYLKRQGQPDILVVDMSAKHDFGKPQQPHQSLSRQPSTSGPNPSAVIPQAAQRGQSVNPFQSSQVGIPTNNIQTLGPQTNLHSTSNIPTKPRASSHAIGAFFRSISSSRAPSKMERTTPLPVSFKEQIALPYSQSVPSRLINRLHVIDGTLTTEGLFRKSGSETVIVSMKKQFNEGVGNVEDGISDVHVLTGLIKAYYREQPTHMVQMGTGYSELYQAAEEFYHKVPNVQVADTERLYAVVRAHVSPVWRVHLSHLIQLLNGVAAQRTTNLMNEHNIAVVVGPNMFPEYGDDVMSRVSTDTVIWEALMHAQRVLPRLFQ